MAIENTTTQLLLTQIKENPKKSSDFLILKKFLDGEHGFKNKEGNLINLMVRFEKAAMDCAFSYNDDVEKMVKFATLGNVFSAIFIWPNTEDGADFWKDVNGRWIPYYTSRKYRSYDDLCNEYSMKAFDEQKDKETKVHITYPIDVPNSSVDIAPSEATLNLLTYLTPMCITHIVNPQIDDFNKFLDENHCKYLFYENLRHKKKRYGADAKFKEIIQTGELRSLIYWAFDPSASKEGFRFWDKLNTDWNVKLYNLKNKTTPTIQPVHTPMYRSYEHVYYNQTTIPKAVETIAQTMLKDKSQLAIVVTTK